MRNLSYGQEIHCFLCNLKYHHHVHKNMPLLILRLRKQSTPSYPVSFRPILMLSSCWCLSLSSFLFHSHFLKKKYLYAFYTLIFWVFQVHFNVIFPSMLASPIWIPAPPMSFSFDLHNHIWWRLKLWRPLLFTSFQLLATYSLLGPVIFCSTLLKYPQSVFILCSWRPSSMHKHNSG